LSELLVIAVIRLPHPVPVDAYGMPLFRDAYSDAY
jgi:hypothetical protein